MENETEFRMGSYVKLDHGVWVVAWPDYFSTPYLSM